MYNNKNKPMLRYKFGSVYKNLYVYQTMSIKQQMPWLEAARCFHQHGNFQADARAEIRGSS